MATEAKESRSAPPIQKTHSKENIISLLHDVLHIPLRWLVIICMTALFSTIEVSWTRNTGFSFTFHVTTITAILLALFWLPALLSLFSLVGGSVKTSAGEMNTPGLSNLLPLLDDPALGVLLDQTAAADKNNSDAQKLQQELKEAYVARIPATKRRKTLELMAEQYETLRQQLPSSDARTMEMHSLMQRMQALIPEAHFTQKEVLGYLTSQHDGERILGLSIALIAPNLDYFDALLSMIDASHSAFEQNRALKAMRKLVPLLTKAQRKNLREVITLQRQYDPVQHRWISPGIDRDVMSQNILDEMGWIDQREVGG